MLRDASVEQQNRNEMKRVAAWVSCQIRVALQDTSLHVNIWISSNSCVGMLGWIEEGLFFPEVFKEELN